MSFFNKVIWTEGMFLRPQHFQQQDRYIESLVDARCASLRWFGWGYSEFELDEGALLQGKIKLNKAKCIFQDGTPFNSAYENVSLTKEFTQGVNDQIIYLCIPIRRENQIEADRSSDPDNLARYRTTEEKIRDNNAGYSKEPYDIQVGSLQPQIRCEKEERSGFWSLAITKIIEVQDDSKIIIDKKFIPPILTCAANSILRDFLIELKGLLHGRGEMLANRAAGIKQVVSLDDLKDLMQLQTINRYESLLSHLAQNPFLHPEAFFTLGLQLIGDLATIYDASKRHKEMPIYNHDNLQECMISVLNEIRRLLNVVVQDNVKQIVIEFNPKNSSQCRTSQIPEDWLLKARFILIVRANMDQETLKVNFKSQVKLSSPWKRVEQLIQLNLPGTTLKLINTIPKGIPIYNDRLYFELDRQCDEWTLLSSDPDKRIWFHIGGSFSDLKLEMWTIRE